MTERLPYKATELARAYAGIASLPVSVLLDNVRSLYNVGAFFRTCEAVRAEKLYLAGFTARPPHRGIAKTALGAERTVPWEASSGAAEIVARLRHRGYQIAAVETAPRAVDLYDWRPSFPVCLLFGHEVDGLARDLVEQADLQVRIPMLGEKHSLNVATAGGVVLYELLRKYRLLHG